MPSEGMKEPEIALQKNVVIHFYNYSSSRRKCKMPYLVISWKKSPTSEPLLVKVNLLPATPIKDTKLSLKKNHLGHAVTNQAHFVWLYDAEVKKTLPQWSACAAEQAFLSKLPRGHLRSLQVVKLVTSNLVIPHRPEQQIDHYLLKNVLMWGIAKGDIPQERLTTTKAVLDVSQKLLRGYLDVCDGVWADYHPYFTDVADHRSRKKAKHHHLLCQVAMSIVQEYKDNLADKDGVAEEQEENKTLNCDAMKEETPSPTGIVQGPESALTPAPVAQHAPGNASTTAHVARKTTPMRTHTPTVVEHKNVSYDANEPLPGTSKDEPIDNISIKSQGEGTNESAPLLTQVREPRCACCPCTLL